MFLERRVIVVYALEPIHLGSARGSAKVDLPVARDARTKDPILTFSALRGMLREALIDDREWAILLGDKPVTGTDNTRRGVLSPTDAWPLLFPVRTSRGGSAWITSARLLQAFAEVLGVRMPLEDDASHARIDVETVLAVTGGAAETPAAGRQGVVLVAGRRYPAASDEGVLCWLAGKLEGSIPVTRLARRTAVVPNDDFASIVAEETERRDRVRINNEQGIVAEGALFSLELVPRDTVFFGSILATSPGLWPRAIVAGDEEEPSRGDAPASLATSSGARDDLATTASALERTAVRLHAATQLTIGGEITVGMGRCQARLIH